MARHHESVQRRSRTRPGSPAFPSFLNLRSADQKFGSTVPAIALVYRSCAIRAIYTRRIIDAIASCVWIASEALRKAERKHGFPMRAGFAPTFGLWTVAGAVARAEQGRLLAQSRLMKESLPEHIRQLRNDACYAYSVGNRPSGAMTRMDVTKTFCAGERSRSAFLCLQRSLQP